MIFLNFTVLFFIAVGLSMDAFSAAVCKGTCMKRLNIAGASVTALFFGVFQGLMPLIGYILSKRVTPRITAYGHITAFLLLGVIGGKMINEALHDDENLSEGEYRLNIGELIVLSIATSIDALAAGIIFAAENIPPVFACAVISVTAFVLSFAGAAVGSRFGNRFGNKAELTGGVILVLMGIRMLSEGIK